LITTGTGRTKACFASRVSIPAIWFLAVARAVEGGWVSLALAHQMDGELKICMDPAIAEELALTLARAADEAREQADEDEGED